MYIVFEGVDGVGKSTQLELVKERLELILERNNDDVKVVTIAENELDKNEIMNSDDEVEMTLRYALQRRLLLNSLDNDYFMNDNTAILLSDRSFYSSMAYQTRYTLDNDYVHDVNVFVPQPSMVFFFDKGCPSDPKLHAPYNNYFSVLPLSTIYVDTKNHSLSQTTNFITRKILRKYDELFPNLLNDARF